MIDPQRKKAQAEGNLKVLKLIRSLDDAFCEELGPVPVAAQERIRIPEGLALEENLRELDSNFGDSEPPSSSIFAPRHGERIEE